jgi:hypothetical protein
LFNLIKKKSTTNKRNEKNGTVLDLCSLLSLLPCPSLSMANHERIRWSSPLRGRNRAMAVNPAIRLGSKRAHTQTTVLDQLKKTPAESRYSLRQ